MSDCCCCCCSCKNTRQSVVVNQIERAYREIVRRWDQTSPMDSPGKYTGLDQALVVLEENLGGFCDFATITEEVME